MQIKSIGIDLVLVQPEMEKQTFSVSVDSAPSGRGFSRHRGLSSDDFVRVSVQRERIALPRC